MAWVNIGAAASGFENVFAQADVSGMWSNNGKITMYGGTASNTTMATNTFYHVAAVNTAGNWQYYLNGQKDGTMSRTINTTYTGSICDNGTGGECLTGSIDELRVSNTNRSEGWVVTAYNSQNSPATFITIGSETTDAVSSTRPSVTITGMRIIGGKVEIR